MLLAARTLQSWYPSTRRAWVCRPAKGLELFLPSGKHNGTVDHMPSHLHHCATPYRFPVPPHDKPSPGISQIIAASGRTQEKYQERVPAWIVRFCRLGSNLNRCFLQPCLDRSHTSPRYWSRAPIIAGILHGEPQRMCRVSMLRWIRLSCSADGSV